MFGFKKEIRESLRCIQDSFAGIPSSQPTKLWEGQTRTSVLRLGYLRTQNLGLSSKEVMKGRRRTWRDWMWGKIKGGKSRNLTEQLLGGKMIKATETWGAQTSSKGKSPCCKLAAEKEAVRKSVQLAHQWLMKVEAGPGRTFYEQAGASSGKAAVMRA